MSTTTTPRPAPPAAPAPLPAPPRRRGRSRILIAALGVALVVAAVVTFTMVQPRNDAKDVLRDARPPVQRSLAISREARDDIARFAEEDSAAAGRDAVAQLDEVIALRRRAIDRLAPMDDVGFPGDANYKETARIWEDALRDSIKATRELRDALPRRMSTEYLQRRTQATEIVAKTLVAQRYDKLLRDTDRELVQDLI